LDTWLPHCAVSCTSRWSRRRLNAIRRSHGGSQPPPALDQHAALLRRGLPPLDSRLSGDHYEALIEGEWRRVPEHLILNRADNPTGRAVACWTKQTGILCFVRAPES
jgi:hypothetical protein